MRLAVVALLAAAALSAPDVSAQTPYPSRPITFIVPFTPGSSPDVMARVVADTVSRDLAQPVIIENRVGAGGNIAAEYVSRQPADGHTVFVGTTGNMAVAKSLYAKLPYDPAQSFTPVSLGWMTWNVLIVPANSPFKTVQDVIAAAKARPGKLNFGSPGVGTAGHLTGEWFKRLTATDIVHVAYKGQNQVVQDLLAGNIELDFETVGTAVPVIKSGQTRALAVTSKERLAALPDVPTFAEAGVSGIDLSAWGMFVVPAGTPTPVVERLNAALVKALATPAVSGRIDGLGAKTTSSSPAETRAMLLNEIAKWARIVEAAQVRLDN